MPLATWRLAAAATALAIALVIFAWLALANPSRDTAQAVTALAGSIQLQDAGLRQAQARSAPGTGATARTMNGFLKQINDALAANDVHVVRLAPQPKDERRIDAELTASFGSFLRFAVALEALGGTMHDLHITRSREAQGDTAGDDFIFMIDMPAGPGFRGKHIDALRALAADPKLPDIFAPVGGDAAGGSADLSSQYKLTAVTLINQRYLATINDFDYAVGDAVGSMTIADIAADHVDLVNDGKHFVLRFQGKGQ
jgi:hypothetical protein